MSLDVYLSRKKIVSYDEGKTFKDEFDEVFWANITHNLGEMAQKAGIYEALWRPEEISKVRAGDIIGLLEDGLKRLRDKPGYYISFNPENGWGDYEGFVDFVSKYLDACKQFPESIIRISR